MQLNAWVADEVGQFFEAEAKRTGLSKSRLAARLLTAGIVAAADEVK